MIERKCVYPGLDRVQWIGFQRAFFPYSKKRFPDSAKQLEDRLSFTTISMGLVKPEGAQVLLWALNEESAWKVFDLGLKDWLKDKPGIICWRMPPQIEVGHAPGGTVTVDQFYSVPQKIEVGKFMYYTVTARLGLVESEEDIASIIEESQREYP